jgi:Bacterial Ig-like domain (group 3)
MNRSRGFSKLLTRGAYACVSFSLCASAQIKFGAVDISSSKTESVTVTFAAAAVLTKIDTLTEVVPNLDFVLAKPGTCIVGKEYAKGATCTAEVTFKPQAAGTRRGAIVLRDYQTANPQQIVVGTTYLQGDGVGPQTTFSPGTWNLIGEFDELPEAVAVDGNGNVYSAEPALDLSQGGYGDVSIETRMSNGSYVQSDIWAGYQWISPGAIAVDGAGNLYVIDAGDLLSGGENPVPPAVYKDVLQIAAADPQPDGYRQFAIGDGWKQPGAIAVDGGGNLYIADMGRVVKETLHPDGSYVASTIARGLGYISGIAVDGSGNVYISDLTKGAIDKETPSNGKYQGARIAGGFNSPWAVAVDGIGNVYIADVGTGSIKSAIYKETLLSNGSYIRSTVVSGGDLGNPYGLAVDGEGNVYVADPNHQEVWGLDLANPPSLQFDSTKIGSTSPGGPQKIEVFNFGNAALKFSGVSYPPDFPENDKSAGECTANTSLRAAESCNLSIDFSPITPTAFASDSLMEPVTITTDTLNAKDTEQAAAVTGVELSDSHKATATVSLEVSANPSAKGSPLTITANVKGAKGLARPTGAVAFYSGTANLGKAQLNNKGLASLTTGSLVVGSHIITAIYSGDSTYFAEDSANSIVESILPASPSDREPGVAISGQGDH